MIEIIDAIRMKEVCQPRYRCSPSRMSCLASDSYRSPYEMEESVTHETGRENEEYSAVAMSKAYPSIFVYSSTCFRATSSCESVMSIPVTEPASGE